MTWYDFAHPLMNAWSAMHEVEDAGRGRNEGG